jgi:hypothetical protein
MDGIFASKEYIANDGAYQGHDGVLPSLSSWDIPFLFG